MCRVGRSPPTVHSPSLRVCFLPPSIPQYSPLLLSLSPPLCVHARTCKQRWQRAFCPADCELDPSFACRGRGGGAKLPCQHVATLRDLARRNNAPKGRARAVAYSMQPQHSDVSGAMAETSATLYFHRGGSPRHDPTCGRCLIQAAP